MNPPPSLDPQGGLVSAAKVNRRASAGIQTAPIKGFLLAISYQLSVISSVSDQRKLYNILDVYTTINGECVNYFSFQYTM